MIMGYIYEENYNILEEACYADEITNFELSIYFY